MTQPREPIEDRSESFVRFNRKSLIGLVVVTLALGGVGISAALSTQGSNAAKVPWWFLPVLLAVLVGAWNLVVGRRWPADAPEVKVAMQDEWRRSNLDRASRLALVTVLIAQWPLGIALGLLTDPRLTLMRITSAMAGATVTLGIVTVLVLFLRFDRE